MSPISSCPFVLYKFIPKISLGTWVLLWNVLFAILEIPVAGKNYKLYKLTQIPLAFLLGAFTDFVKYLLNPIEANQYPFRLICVFVGIAFTALGVYLSVKAKLIMNGPEAFLHSLSERAGVAFGNLKMAFDISNVVLAGVLSLILFKKLVGMREGTILAAVLTGVLVNLYAKLFEKRSIRS